MIIPMLCVTIFVILVVWFLLPRVARLMIHTPTAISIFVCLSMVQLMAVFISMQCTLCGHFLQVALTLSLVVGYAIFFFQAEDGIRDLYVTGVQTCALPIWRFSLATCSACIRVTPSVVAGGWRSSRKTRVNTRSEERRVGKECRARGVAYPRNKKYVACQLRGLMVT